jgi:hypothetical protein
MTLPIYRSSEPLYTIIVREPDAKVNLTKWSTCSKSIQAKVDENKLHIYDHNTLNLFVATWAWSWDRVTIWDVWSKRHIYFY